MPQHLDAAATLHLEKDPEMGILQNRIKDLTKEINGKPKKNPGLSYE